MPIYLDLHEDLGGISAVEVAAAHMRDLAVQESYGVNYLTYWFDPWNPSCSPRAWRVGKTQLNR